MAKEKKVFSLHHSITHKRLIEAASNSLMFGLDNPGFCVECGHAQEGCEPDARKYKCAACGERKVYGAEELIMMIG